MANSTILVFGNKIFLEILNELDLFPHFKFKNHIDFDMCIKEAEEENSLVIFFISKETVNFINKYKVINFPSLLIFENAKPTISTFIKLNEKLNTPFTILELEKKLVSLFAKRQFKKNSLIKLNDYIIDKNERKIIKKGLELHLSEKEINFLVLFSRNKEPITKSIVLKTVWNYSAESETHTVETHIHRLRKKILEKFGDRNFIKNNKKGYFV